MIYCVAVEKIEGKRKPDDFFTSPQAGLPQKYTPPSGGVIFHLIQLAVFLEYPFEYIFLFYKNEKI